jgi:hypothetical protein
MYGKKCPICRRQITKKSYTKLKKENIAVEDNIIEDNNVSIELVYQQIGESVYLDVSNSYLTFTFTRRF